MGIQRGKRQNERIKRMGRSNEKRRGEIRREKGGRSTNEDNRRDRRMKIRRET